jgi:hypothetical protein
MGETRRVFLSYVREDADYAHALADALTAAGFAAWTDRAIRPGDRWDLAVEDAMANSDVYVVLVTPAALASTWAHFEIGVALGRADTDSHVRVIPVLRGAVAWHDLPFALRRHAGVDATDRKPQEVAARLAEALAPVAA